MKKKEKNLNRQSFMSGVIILMFSQVIVKILGLVVKIYQTNKAGFGDTGNAIYGSGYQIYALLLAISSTGIPNAISKLISERVEIKDYKGSQKVFRVAMLVVGGIGLLGTLMLLLGAGFISSQILSIPEAKLTIMILSPSVFFVAIASVIRGYFNGRSQMGPTANSQAIEQTFKTIFTIIFMELVSAFLSTSAELMSAGATLATTVSVIAGFIYIYMYYLSRKKEINNELAESEIYNSESVKSITKKILQVSIPISLTSIISSINKNIDAMTVVRGLTKIMSEANAKAQYGILTGKVDTLIGLPLSFNVAFATALVPAIAAAKINNDKDTIIKRISLSLLISMLIALPCAVGLCIFAQPILNLVFPNANAGATILQAISMLIVFTTLAQTVNGALQGLGRYKVPVVALSVGVVVKTLLNIILVPNKNFGIYGATISSIVCHLISFSIGYVILKKEKSVDLNMKQFIVKPFIATGLMGLVSYCCYKLLLSITSANLSTIISLLIAVVTYFIAIILLKILSKEDLQSIPYGNKVLKLLQKIKIY